MKLIVWEWLQRSHFQLPHADAIHFHASVHLSSIVMLSDGPALTLAGPVWVIEGHQGGMHSIWILGEAPPLVSPDRGVLLGGYEL